MALDANIVGGSTLVANVDTNNNLTVNLPYTDATDTDIGGGTGVAGFAAILGEADSGSITGTREVRAMEITTDYRVRTGVDVTMFNEFFPGAALNTSLWTSPVSTSTTTLAGGFATLNSAGSLASSAVARLQTYRLFPIYATYPTYATFQIAFSSAPVPNCVHEWGMFFATGTAAPTDGAFFRVNAATVFQAVVNINGVENPVTITDFATLVGTNTTRQFLITIGSANVDFWINNVKVAQIPLPVAYANTTSCSMLPVTLRSYNSALVSGTASLMKIGAVNVTLGEMNANKSWSHVMASSGGMSYQGQTGQTLGSTANYANSGPVGAGAAASNSTAALGSGLGGQFTLLPTLTVGTDGIISSYMVPLGTATVPGKSLVVTGYTIEGVVTTALVGGPVIGFFSFAYGHNAAGLATATTATSKAAVRLPLGIQQYPVTAAVGAQGARLQDDFDRAPIVVYPGEFIQVVMKNVGTVTSAGAITFLIRIDGYWE